MDDVAAVGGRDREKVVMLVGIAQRARAQNHRAGRGPRLERVESRRLPTMGLSMNTGTPALTNGSASARWPVPVAALNEGDVYVSGHLLQRGIALFQPEARNKRVDLLVGAEAVVVHAGITRDVALLQNLGEARRVRGIDIDRSDSEHNFKPFQPLIVRLILARRAGKVNSFLKDAQRGDRHIVRALGLRGPRAESAP